MNREDWKDFCTFVLVIAIIISISFAIVSVPLLISSSKRARVINEEFGTQYTTWDMFLAGKTIERVLIGQKHHIEINEEVIGK